MTSITLGLSLITFNIHGFVNQFWTGWHKERTIGKLLQTGHEGKPFDFCVLQEAWDPTTSKIIKRVGKYKHAVHSQRPSPCQVSVYGNGLATLSNWTILERGHETWKNKNPRQFEGGLGAWKGFSYVKFQHPVHAYIKLTIYNAHGMSADYKKTQIEKMVYENFVQMGKHIAEHTKDEAVILGMDSNWRHRFRAPDARPGKGAIDASYNAAFNGLNMKRYDAFEGLTESAGGELFDVEWLLKNDYTHLAPVDKIFVKNGKDIAIRLKESPYLYKESPWSGLSDHHPVAMYFEITARVPQSAPI